MASELGTEVDLRFEPGGLQCEFGGALQKAAPGALSSSPVFTPDD